MSDEKYLLPMTPIVIGFVISFVLIGVGLANPRAYGGLFGAGAFFFLLSLGLLFIIRNENENIRDQGELDWWDIKDDGSEAQLEEQAERSKLVEAGLADLDLVRTRLRQGAYLFVVVAIAAFGYMVFALWRDELTRARGLVAFLSPYAIWSAYWGAVSIFARSPNREYRSEGFDIAEPAVMPNMRGAESLAILASLFYGVLGAGPMEYLRHRHALTEAANDDGGPSPR